MRKSVLLFLGFLVASCLFSCAKEEFATPKVPQNSSVDALARTSSQVCSKSTLVSPKVDVLLLWDNSSSALFINSKTRKSYNQLIASVSEKFDYHILSAPLISTNSNSLSQASLVANNPSSISGTALGILKTKEQASSALSFSQALGSAEPGIDRASSIIEANRENGIFRNDSYTIIVVMSNGDDNSCELGSGVSSCAVATWDAQIQGKINKLLCLRGNVSGIDCSGTTSLNSTMMRYVNITPLTKCLSGINKISSRYKKVSKQIYEQPYTNGWPTSNDNINPFTTPNGVSYPDSYDLCSINPGNIFDGVNSAIKQTLLKHVYDFWPVAESSTLLDTNSIRVIRDDGKVLVNRTGQSNPPDGFSYIGNQINHRTRSSPTFGENYTGKMIQLFGGINNDQIVYPRCLTVTYDAPKSTFGYIYLKFGQPYLETLEVFINGNLIPQNATNGWNYMGSQNIANLNSSLKVVDLPSGASSGLIIRLNGNAKFSNVVGSSVDVVVKYTSVTP